MTRIVSLLAGIWVCVLVTSGLPSAGAWTGDPTGAAQAVPTVQGEKSPERALLDKYCVGCHNQRTKTAGLTLDVMDTGHVGESAASWEKVVRKLRGGQMPPANLPRPDETTRDAFVGWLE